jgi:hypothetical protein
MSALTLESFLVKDIEYGYKHELTCSMHGIIKKEDIKIKTDRRGEIEICPHCNRELHLSFLKRTLEEQMEYDKQVILEFAKNSATKTRMKYYGQL